MSYVSLPVRLGEDKMPRPDAALLLGLLHERAKTAVGPIVMDAVEVRALLVVLDEMADELAALREESAA